GGARFRRAGGPGRNDGCARPPFTRLRVVATSKVGSTESDEASKDAPVAPRPAHPPSASTLAADASPRRTARRDAIASCCSKCRTITGNLREHYLFMIKPRCCVYHNGGEKRAGRAAPGRRARLRGETSNRIHFDFIDRRAIRRDVPYPGGRGTLGSEAMVQASETRR